MTDGQGGGVTSDNDDAQTMTRRIEYAVIAVLAFLLCIAALAVLSLSKQVSANKAEVARLGNLVRILGGNPAPNASPGPVPPQRIIVEVVPGPQGSSSSVTVTESPRVSRTPASSPSGRPSPRPTPRPSPSRTPTPTPTPSPTPTCLIPPLICP